MAGLDFNKVIFKIADPGTKKGDRVAGTDK
jgi:hypothetical protein